MRETRPLHDLVPPIPPAPSEGSRAIRWLVRRTASRCLRWSFRQVRLFGADRIPLRGPLLLIGNHPNDLPDVLLGFSVTPRPLRFIATLAAASSWPARKVYVGLGVIPVVRVRDARAQRRKGTDMKAVNATAGSLVSAAFSAGHAVAVFPEGGVHNVPHVGRPRAGVVKMLLEYPDSGAPDLTIVPFGVQYEAPHQPGSDCCVVVGTPFSLHEWRRNFRRHVDSRGATSAPGDADRDDPGDTPVPSRSEVSALAATLHDTLQSVTRNARSWEEAAARDRLIAAVAGGIGAADPLALAVSLVPHADSLTRNQTDAGDVDQLVRMQTIADELSQAVVRCGGIPTSAQDHADLRAVVKGAATARSAGDTSLWLSAPLAAVGWLVHGPVFFANWKLARRLAKAPSDLIARTYMPGLYLVLAWYLLIAGVLAAGLRAADLSMWWAAGFLLLAPKLGDVAVAWRHRWRRRQFMARARSWPAAERERLATAYNSLVAWWEESSPDSHPAPPADSIKLPRSYRSDHSNSSAGSQQA